MSGIADGSALVIIPSNPPQDIIVGGDVVGPASATTGNFASFADASGSALADSDCLEHDADVYLGACGV